MAATDERTNFLGIYLEDHVAGAIAIARRAARLAEAEATSADAGALATLADDIASDRDVLLTLTERMGFEPSRLKSSLASLGERLGALKPNGRVLTRSPLSTIVELEALQMAVRAKRSLWETLQVSSAPDRPVDLDALIGRADDQAKVLSDLHRARTATTF
jgi:hypothetical protein